MKISYTAPAKVILSGEHAVVFGKPALVSTINLKLKFSVWDEKCLVTEKNILLISRKVKDFLRKTKIIFSEKPFNFKIESEVPVGRGLGSSAALSVAAVATFLEFYTGRQFEKKIINDLAYQIEKIFHKNPSGVDNTAVCFGGLILYHRKINSLKYINNLNYKITDDLEKKLYLIDSGKPTEKTAKMVNSVAKLHDKAPRLTNIILNDIEKTTNKIKISLMKKDAISFKKSLVVNELLLEKLNVVSKKTRILLTELSKFGVGKITGAGGKKTDSGFILFLSDDKVKLEEFLKNRKISFYKFSQDTDGLNKL